MLNTIITDKRLPGAVFCLTLPTPATGHEPGHSQDGAGSFHTLAVRPASNRSQHKGFPSMNGRRSEPCPLHVEGCGSGYEAEMGATTQPICCGAVRGAATGSRRLGIQPPS